MVKSANCCWRVLDFQLAAVRSVSASEQQNIKSFSMIVALLVSSGITWHVLQHGAMSHWQHSFTGQASRSMQHPTLHSLSAPQTTNLSPEEQAGVAKPNGLHTVVSGSLLRFNNAVQARVRRIDPSADALGMLFYSDATKIKMNKHKFHPLLVMLANFTLDA